MRSEASLVILDGAEHYLWSFWKPAQPHPQSSRKARSAYPGALFLSFRKARSAYPESRKVVDHGGMDGRGFWIPARTPPAQGRGRLAGMTE